MMKIQRPPVSKTPPSITGTDTNSGDSVKIGLLHSLSGTMALSEKPLLDAEQMAIDEINRAGGILGCRIEPVVADGASLPERFAQAAQDLLAAGVSALFGCWTSASRKAVRPVVEASDSLLLYPVQYEGLEESSCICYSGSCLNQQIIPAVEWTLEQFGNRVFLLGSDYVFPRTANQLIRSMVTSHGGNIVAERYFALGAQDFGEVIAEIRQTRPDAVINTLNGDSNLAFYRQYHAAGILPAQTPIIATSVTETELESVATVAAGHFACWSYFQSLDTPESREFVSRFKGRYGENRLVSAPAVTAYIQVYLWKQAVERAGTFAPSEVRRCLPGCMLVSPMGELRMEANRHLSLPVRIGRLKEDGQFEVVWSKNEVVAPLPWLGVETMDFPGKEMVRQSLAAFADNIDYAWRLEHEIAERKILEAALEKAQINLEGKIEERTRQLEKSIGDLNKEVAERQQAEEVLRESEERFRKVFEEGGLGLAMASLTGGPFISANRAFCEMLGYTEEALKRLTFADVTHPDHRAQDVEAVKRLREGQIQKHTTEKRYLKKNGEVVWGARTLTRIRSADGKSDYALAMIEDITERKRAEQQLHDSEALYHSLVENLPQHVFRKDLAGRFTFGNGPFCQSLGKPLPGILGKTDQDFCPASLATKYRQDDQRVVETGQPFQGEEEHRQADGKTIWVNVTKTPLRDAAGKIVGVQGISWDITERKRAEEAVRESEERYRLLVEESPDAIGIYQDGKLVFVNSAGARLLGAKTTAELLGRESEQMIHPEDFPASRDRIRRRLAGETGVYPAEVRYLRRDGTVVPVEVSATPILFGGKSAVQFIARDITERKRLETELRWSQERFEKLFQSSPLPIGVTSAVDGRILDVNQRWLEIGGYTREEVLGRTPQDIGLWVDPSQREAFVECIKRDGVVREFETRMRGKNGWEGDMLLSGQMLQMPEGPAVLVTAMDITERKRIETALKQSHSLLNATLESTADGILVVDVHGQVTSFNQKFLEMWRIPPSLVARRDDQQLLQFVLDQLEEPAAFLAKVEELYHTQQASSLDELKFRDGRAFERYSQPQRMGDAIVGRVWSFRDITERRRVEEELRASESRQRTIIENEPECIKIVDAQGRLRQMNPAGLAMIEADSLEQVTGLLVLDLIPPKYKTAFAELHERVLAGETRQLEFEMVGLKGGHRWVETHAGPMRDKGETLHLAVTRDITERKRMEEALRRYEMAVEQSSDGIAIADPEGGLTFVNRAWARMHGYEISEMIGQHLSINHTSEQIESDVGPFNREVVKKGEHRGEVGHRRKDGTTFPTWMSTTVLKDDQGKPVGLVGIARDITERKQAEERISEQAALLNAASDAIYVRTLDHTVTYWNDGAERLYGWTRDEALGRKITELGNADHAAFGAAHAVLLAQGNWSGELKKTSKTGKEFFVFCRWTLLQDQQGRPKEVLAINTDITEKKQLETQFLRAQRMEAIGALAGGIAHDLNNVLAPILMSTSLLRETVTDPESRSMLATMAACAQRGADIIKQLLVFARGKPSARVPMPMRHLLQDMEKIMRETFPRNIQPRVGAEKELWPVLGDATQIHQALMNLCVNARDAMPDGGTLTLAGANVTLDAAFARRMPEARLGDYVCISVTDTGSGIAPEHLDRIFDPFFTTKEIGKGTGLGLATVQGIVRGHDGFVRVNSRMGEGTTFELYLPASPEAAVASKSDTEILPPRGHGELILVVDDETSVRGAVQQTLEMHGYRVVAAAEGNDALALFTRHGDEVKAVVTDMMMPGMEGPALIRTLRNLEPKLPILGMTGLAERAGVKGMKNLDLQVLLTKPFTGANLLEALHQALAGQTGTEAGPPLGHQ